MSKLWSASRGLRSGQVLAAAMSLHSCWEGTEGPSRQTQALLPSERPRCESLCSESAPWRGWFPGLGRGFELLPQEGAQVIVQPWPSTEGPCLSLALPAGNWLPSRQLLLGTEMCEGSWLCPGVPSCPWRSNPSPQAGRAPSLRSIFLRLCCQHGKGLGGGGAP